MLIMFVLYLASWEFATTCIDDLATSSLATLSPNATEGKSSLGEGVLPGSTLSLFFRDITSSPRVTEGIPAGDIVPAF